MRNVVDNKGSFTVEASIIATFIVVITINTLLMIFMMYDRCIMYEEVNKNMFLINERINNCEYEIEYDGVLDEYKNKKINSRLLCTRIIDISYKIEKDKICANIIYRIDINNIRLMINKEDGNSCISRKMKVFKIKENVRVIDENLSGIK